MLHVEAIISIVNFENAQFVRRSIFCDETMTSMFSIKQKDAIHPSIHPPLLTWNFLIAEPSHADPKKKERAKQTLSVTRLQSENQVTTRSQSKMFKKREFDMDDDIDTDEPSVSNTIGEKPPKQRRRVVW